MEKKLLSEINQMRKIMGLSLLVEAGPWAELIGHVVGGSVGKDIKLTIGKTLKTVLISDI